MTMDAWRNNLETANYVCRTDLGPCGKSLPIPAMWPFFMDAYDIQVDDKSFGKCGTTAGLRCLSATVAHEAFHQWPIMGLSDPWPYDESEVWTAECVTCR
jgi:hypothetical protein